MQSLMVLAFSAHLGKYTLHLYSLQPAQLFFQNALTDSKTNIMCRHRWKIGCKVLLQTCSIKFIVANLRISHARVGQLAKIQGGVMR
jgi:hypothetical protein